MLDRIQVTKEVEEMCCVKRGVKGEPAPIPQEGDWTKVKEIITEILKTGKVAHVIRLDNDDLILTY